VCAAAAAGSLERRFPGLRELRFSPRALERLDKEGVWMPQLRHLADALPRCGAVERVVLRLGAGEFSAGAYRYALQGHVRDAIHAANACVADVVASLTSLTSLECVLGSPDGHHEARAPAWAPPHRRASSAAAPPPPPPPAQPLLLPASFYLFCSPRGRC